MFQNDLVYRCVVFVPRPGAERIYFMIKWYMSRLPDGFPIAQYPLCTSVDNTHALKLRLQMDINRAKTSNYTVTEPRAQRVQRQRQAAAATPHIGRRPQTR